MALTSPALTLAIDALFGNIKPTLDALKKLGVTDFSDDAPNVDIKPGATIKIPVSSITAASVYNDTTNNYLTGGTTNWATLTAMHYLQGFDISGVNVDQGVDAAKMKQRFTSRAGSGIAAAIQGAIKTALDGVTASTAVTLSSPVVADYLGLGDGVSWLDKSTSVLAVNGATLADIKAKLAAINVVGTLTELGQMMGFADLVLIPGMTAKAVVVPANSMGFIGRVPAIVASYKEVGVETDPDTGLSVGIVVADEQATNRVVANADIWFGCTTQGAPAAATTAGIIKIS
jgi:hypothetical protein